MAGPFSDYMGIHGAALAVRGQRLELLASNIANADTPGYKAQDLDFNAALSAAMQPGAGDRLQAAVGAARYERLSSQPSLDGNTVDGEAEKAAFGRAALEYRASLSFVEAKVRSMMTAITGQ
jgi:flagellar basal-body rod protein FlgB